MARILVVDDSFTARSILKRTIDGEHALREADGGAAALKALETEAFDLMILDLLMPGMDGFATLHAAKRLRPELPVLIVSADIQETTRERVLGAGAAGIVHKPVKKETMLSAIEAALGSV